ncbi:MAG: permease [Candidatus Altiarchaeum hamiconexum]|uniref:Permease n=1 Tax=Candidatus Altarchaeum hamiconexum TaxID=1803513 RepID=A0A8J7YZS9_9ARCH|nr:permease [Candidatus Altarchaeum hamiconexum]NCN68265.1 permease [Candidatus Altarchaeum hamiconexum]NCS90981.1 permease [Candidatus Altarchaeum hamiconexum]
MKINRTITGVVIILLLLGTLVTYEWNKAFTKSEKIKMGEEIKDPFPITGQTPALMVVVYTLGNYILAAWLCLTIAFLIAGAVETFIPKQLIIRHMKSSGIKGYLVGAFGGPLLSVCSCSIIPLFAGIYNRGAGLGPALAFLLSAPAVNVAAVLLTLSWISWEIALGRIILALSAAIIVSFIIAKIFENKTKKEESEKMLQYGGDAPYDGSLRNAFLEWMENTYFLVKQIIPLILLGIVLVGVIKIFLSPATVANYLGEGPLAIAFASVIGVVLYTPTLVEVPFVRGLMELGMGTGPAIAFLLTGPALSLPSLLGISRIVGWKIPLTYAVLVALAGLIGGLIFSFFVPAIILK